MTKKTNGAVSFVPLFEYKLKPMTDDITLVLTSLILSELSELKHDEKFIADANKDLSVFFKELINTGAGVMIYSNFKANGLEEKLTLRTMIFCIALMSSYRSFVPMYADLYSQTLKYISLNEKKITLSILVKYFQDGFPCEDELSKAWDDLKKVRYSSCNE